jgi:hypothetical protein
MSISQTLSPFFKLPAELRITIYELLDFPPVDNEQCCGIILSCRQAKRECEGVATVTTKAWLLEYKRDVLPQCELGVRILLPPVTRAPVQMHPKFHTLRHLTLVFPGHTIHGCAHRSQTFCEAFRPLNSIFGLWLDSLTVYFKGPPGAGGQGDDIHLGARKAFRRLFFILESGFTYAHDPVGQKADLKLNKYGFMVKYWGPKSAFIRKLVLTWDLTDEGLQSEEMILVDGHCRKRPTAECVGVRKHQVTREDELIGEESRESSCRFRPSVNDHRMAGPSDEHKTKCFKCGKRGWDYHRYIRGLPADGDERWL